MCWYRCAGYSVLYSLLGLMAHPALAAQWEQQATRLQLVQASLLDDAPVPSVRPVHQVSLEITTSFLPEVSSHVGGKSESVPTSPIHAVPSVKYGVSGSVSDHWSLAFEARAGFLPEQASRLVGLSATVRQTSFTGQLGLGNDTGFYATTGFHFTKVAVRGGITAKDAQDTFDVSTMAPFVTSTFNVGPFFIAGLLGATGSDTNFHVEADKTSFALSDQRLILQATAGWADKSGFRAALSTYFVPQRVWMPRLTVAYDFAILPKLPPVTLKRDWHNAPVDIYGKPLERSESESRPGMDVYIYDGDDFEIVQPEGAK